MKQGTNTLRISWVALALLAGCAGNVDDGTGGGGDGPRGGDNAGGTAGDGPQGGSGGVNGEPAPELVPSSSRVARLSHTQWENTTRDLLFLPQKANLTATFTGDAIIGQFDNGGGTLRVTDGLFTDYQLAAETLANRVANDAALRGKILPADLPTDATMRAKAFVTAFGRRAFRRPLSDAEITRYANLFAQGNTLYGTTDPLISGVRAVLEAMLQSPYFLYRTELNPGSGKPTPLSSHEIAARLSYAISNSMPDGPLATAADEGKLGATVEGRRAIAEHATRLLATPAGREMVDDFHKQLFRLRTYDGITKNVAKVPEFTAGIGADMRTEALKFTGEVFFESKAGVRDMLLSPVSFVNQKLAKIYGLSGTFDNSFKRVTLDNTQRMGLLTLSGFLASNAHADEVDSIHRGVFVHKHILCTNLPPPAENVPPVPNSGGKTNRERVNAHTGKGTCGASCHATIINPAGFAFEQYDAIGKHRTMENGAPVDASGTLEIDGVEKTWTDALGFIKAAAETDAAHRCFGNAWLEYLQGRSPVDNDTGLLDRTTKMSRGDNASLSEVVLRIVTSDAFVNRAAE